MDGSARLLPPIGEPDRASCLADLRPPGRTAGCLVRRDLTALQLANFWQDFKADYDRGRVYLPLEEQQVHGAREDDLAAAVVAPAWQKALSAATVRTRCLFDEGKPLCNAVDGRLRYELRATWLGGTRILDRLVAVRFDVVNRRPTLGLSDVPWFAWQMLTWANPRVPLAYGSRSL